MNFDPAWLSSLPFVVQLSKEGFLWIPLTDARDLHTEEFPDLFRSIWD
jgi:hypothetical protein